MIPLKQSGQSGQIHREKVEWCCQELGKEKERIAVECVQSFCFAREKMSWGLVAQNVNGLNVEMGQVIDPHILCLPSV